MRRKSSRSAVTHRPLGAYADAYFMVYYGAFELLDPKLKANHDVRLGRNNIVGLTVLLISADVIFNMITNYYTVDNRASLLLERSYNILVCGLILALLNSQLSQRELKDELAGVRYMVEQDKRQYELAKKSVDLINIKYHDLRQQSRRFQDREGREELERTLDEYASLVKTGNEVLDVILTEKTLACREQGIQLLCMADGRGLEFVKTHHLYALLGNAIDNAMEAVAPLPEAKRVISFSLRRQGELVHIHMENPCAGELSMRSGLPVTTKGDEDYIWTGGCYPLITEVLRGEWGFNGFAITDNANTGSPTYMNAYQMIEAGGDGALTTSEYAVWKFDKDDAAHYTYGREAMHHVLYAVANSKVMCGLMPGSTFVTPMTLAEKLVVGIDIGAVVIIAALGYFIYRGFRKPKKQGA